jgi:hypothetical protein
MCRKICFCLYRLRRKEVNGLHYLFGDAPRKANWPLFTPRFTLSSMQGIQHSNLRRAFFSHLARPCA